MISSYYIDTYTGVVSLASPASSTKSGLSFTSSKKKSFSVDKDAVGDLIEKNLYFIELFFANAVANSEEYLLLYQALLRLIATSISLGLLCGVSNNTLRIFFSLYKVVLYYFMNLILPANALKEGHKHEEEDDEEEDEKKYLRKYQNSMLQLILESFQMISTQDIMERHFMKDIFHWVNGISKVIADFNSNNFHLFTKILKDLSENHYEMFVEVKKYFCFLFFILG
jgi:hypothetical protein